MNAIIITKEGKRIELLEWQQLYNLEVGSSHIGHFFSIGEKSRGGKVVIKDGCKAAELLIILLDMVRRLWDEAIYLNSFDRTEEEQQSLRDRGYRTATFSPHVVAMGADIDTRTPKETLKLVATIKAAADILKIKVRIGYKLYMKDGHTFVHVDVCPEYYGKDKAFNHLPHPQAWEVAINW